MKDQATGYLAEAKWFYQNYTPTLDEYITLALVTTAYAMLVTNSFLGMGDVVTKDAFEWVSGNPQMLRASTIVCRFMDDIIGRQVPIFTPNIRADRFYLNGNSDQVIHIHDLVR